MINIEIKNLTFSYKGNKPVFKNLTLSLTSENKHGHIITAMGPSGSGKSTLLKLLLQIEKPQSGSINIFPSNSVISYVPQEPVLFEHLSPEKNARYFQFAGCQKNKFNENLYNELINILDLKDVIEKSKSVNEISGGQKQRLSLLRALSINPEMLLLDEPCNGLDADVKKSFLNKLREITEHYGLFVLYITHHKLEAQLIADEIIYLVQNKGNGIVSNVVKGTVLDFIHKPPIIEAARVFRFPDIKIIPILQSNNGRFELTTSERATHFWLLEDENIIFTKESDWKFKLLSKSPVFSVIKHEQSNLEIMLKTKYLNHHHIGDDIYLKISGEPIVYDNNGLLYKNKD